MKFFLPEEPMLSDLLSLAFDGCDEKSTCSDPAAAGYLTCPWWEKGKIVIELNLSILLRVETIIVLTTCFSWW